MKISKMLIKPALPNCVIFLTFNLELNVSLISNKAPNLRSVICSEIKTASITNKRLRYKERGSYKFMFSLETVSFYCKKILQLIINLTYGLLCF